MTAPASSSARFLIVGPQGSGKGTQGVLVAGAFEVPSISTGDVFRENISGGTELGERVQAIVEAGDLVPDELTCELVRDRLAQPDAARGFLLDGFPRNRAQVDDLEAFLASRGEALDAVIELVVPREESIAPAPPARDRPGPHRRHRRGHRQPPRDLRARDGADPRRVPRRAGSSCASTASGRSTR